MIGGDATGEGSTGADARSQLIELYQAAVAGANVEALTADAVAAVPLERRHRVWLFAIGKAAHAMAKAAVNALQRAHAEIAGGIVVAAAPGDAPTPAMSAMTGDHPVPGPRSFAAATRIGQVLAQKRAGDVAIVLLSGGASSLIAAPLRGMSEPDVSQLFELLLGSGLDIHQMNAIRKRFSRWGAGRLALKLAPMRTHCFAVSDVIGDDLATIGSGPVVPDPTTAQQVIDLLEQVSLSKKVSTSFRQLLRDTIRGAAPETPKAAHPAFAHVEARVVANNGSALRSAARLARTHGLSPVIQDAPLLGAAAAAGARVADALLALRESTPVGSARCCLWGGETTVTLGSGAPPGGRCQELALAAAQRLADAGERAAGIVLLAAGTDGRDGPTDAAGAIVDGATWRAIGSAGLDAADALRKHESYTALAAANALFRPGLTGTNVMDVTIGLIRR